MFPSVFLAKVGKLSNSCSMYKDCFDLLTRKYGYVILPANQTDFSNLIFKLQKFLEIIDSEIGNARIKRITKDEFFSKTGGRLRSVNTFAQHLGDLLSLWNNGKEFFWSLVSLDYSLARKKMAKLVIEKTGEFSRICEGHSVEFSNDEENLSDGLYILIKDCRTKGAIKHSANDADLLILADCFIFKNKRFLQGFMYLITDDGELHGTTAEIIEHPDLVFPDLKSTDRFVGFEPLRPKRFLNNFKPKE